MGNTFGGAGITAEEVATAVWSVDLTTGTAEAVVESCAADAKLSRQAATNKAVISEDRLSVTIYDDDGVTPLYEFDISGNRLIRTPV